jgi:hypothetical protein
MEQETFDNFRRITRNYISENGTLFSSNFFLIAFVTTEDFNHLERDMENKFCPAIFAYKVTFPRNFFFIDTFVSLAIPSLQLRLTTNLFSNLDSTLKTNTQYLSIDQCRVLVLICSHILLAQIPLALSSAFNSDHYAH